MRLNWAERLVVNNPVRVAIQGHLIRWINKVAAIPPDSTCLEIGCGRGAGASLLLQQFLPRRLFALDLDETMIRQGQAYLARRRMDRIHLLVGDATRLPFPSGSMQAIFGFGVLHHLPDWQAGLAEITRVLAVGGVYFLEEFYPELYLNFLAKRIFDHPEANRFDSPTLHQALRGAGLDLIGRREISHFGILAVCRKISAS
jgi:ubiquinone/menaquinone biosynthesis C-methylase UbiE